jgi:2',3'-cyclic-nucleotide 2'-phosphodiesterase (5'-nucleotidase family)
VLVLDSGNTLFGKDPSNSSQGAVQIKAMNLMGYDAMAFGEVDLGVPATVLQERFKEAQFVAVSANLQPADKLPIQPYVLKQVDGHTAAIIGATATNAAKRTQTGINQTVEPPLEAISRTVAGLRNQADVIIILSNLSVKENEALATTVPGIDVILGSHDTGAKIGSRAMTGPDGQVVLAVTMRLGEFLGVLAVHFDAAGRVVNFSGQDLALLEKYADDPAMVELLAQYGVKP